MRNQIPIHASRNSPRTLGGMCSSRGGTPWTSKSLSMWRGWAIRIQRPITRIQHAGVCLCNQLWHIQNLTLHRLFTSQEFLILCCQYVSLSRVQSAFPMRIHSRISIVTHEFLVIVTHIMPCVMRYMRASRLMSFCL